MIDNAIEMLLKPLSRRLGTFVAATLVTAGVVASGSEMVVQIENAVTAVLLVGVDLVLSYRNRKVAK